MYEFIRGEIIEITPTTIILENHGIGFSINITLETYSNYLKFTDSHGEILLYIHQVLREDSNTMYGFTTKEERAFFRLLISVSGIGPGTAIKALACAQWEDLALMVANNDLVGFKKIKGIGPKTAQQIIYALEDKIDLEPTKASNRKPEFLDAMIKDAILALATLGFPKPKAKKICEDLANENPNITVEQLIKQGIAKM